jgi:hypothetical protein
MTNNFEGLRDEMGDDMCIPGGILFMRGVVPSFSFAVSVAASQKKPDSSTPKMENTLFVGRNKNWPLWRSSPSQWTGACLIWPRFNKLCHDQGQI